MATPPGSNSQAPYRWVAALLIAAFAAWAIPLWAIRFMQGRGAWDQYFYHLKAIRRFAEQWPRFGLSDYESATTPGYHILLASVPRIVSDPPVLLQIMGSGFTLALLGLVGAMIARRAARSGITPLAATSIALPVACSMYVVFPGVWLLPDNAGWLGVVAILALTLEPRRGVRWLIAAALTLLALVLVRQNHIWAAAPIWLGAWLNAAPTPDASLRTLFSNPAARIPRTLFALALTLPAALAVAWFFNLWHGPVPPSFQKQHAGFNYATPAFVLSLIAVYSFFFIAWLRVGLATIWGESRPLLFLAALVGALVAIIPTTTFLDEARKGGLWNFTLLEGRFGLTIAHHTSPLILVLSTLGAVCIAAWLARLSSRDRLIFAAAILAFTAAQTVNANCWQRYIEPFLLIVIALMAVSAQVPRADSSKGLKSASPYTPLRLLGPLALAALLAGVTIHALLTAQPLPQ